jgi:histidyl-tRNA synthetase
MASAPLLLDHLDAEDAEHFAQVQELLRTAEIPFELDPALVRGLDYYTRTVFEFTSDALGAQSGVGGGGRYDGLAEELGGAPTPGMGWAAGVERMLLAAEERPVPEAVCDLYVALAGDAAGLKATAFALAAEARRAQVPAQLELAGRSLKGQLKQAGRLGARYVAILGDDGIALKDMESGEQETVASPSAVVAHVLRGRHPG